jgi:hypothetical protein
MVQMMRAITNMTHCVHMYNALHAIIIYTRILVTSVLQCLNEGLSKAKKLHIIASPNRHSVAHTSSINTLNIGSVHSLSVAALRRVCLRASRFVVVVPKHTGPLLHRLRVVRRPESGVRTSVVDLHLRASTLVVGVHGEDDISPGLGSRDGVSLSTGGVPGIYAVGG